MGERYNRGKVGVNVEIVLFDDSLKILMPTVGAGMALETAAYL